MSKLILFDFDGTLKKFDILKFMTLQKNLFDKFNIEFPFNDVDEFQKGYFEPYLDFYIHHGFDVKNDFEEMTEVFKSEYKKFGAPQLIDGLSDILDLISNEGHKMGIVSSNYFDHVKSELIEMGTDHHMDVIVAHGSGHGEIIPKPHPMSVLKAIEELGVDKEDVIYIGDYFSDVLAAKAAGVNSIAVTYGIDYKKRLQEHKPDYVVDNVEELKEAINDWLSKGE